MACVDKRYRSVIEMLVDLLGDANEQVEELSAKPPFSDRALLQAFKTDMELAFAAADAEMKNVDDKQRLQVVYDRFQFLMSGLIGPDPEEGD